MHRSPLRVNQPSTSLAVRRETLFGWEDLRSVAKREKETRASERERGKWCSPWLLQEFPSSGAGDEEIVLSRLESNFTIHLSLNSATSRTNNFPFWLRPWEWGEECEAKLFLDCTCLSEDSEPNIKVGLSSKHTTIILMESYDCLVGSVTEPLKEHRHREREGEMAMRWEGWRTEQMKSSIRLPVAKWRSKSNREGREISLIKRNKKYNDINIPLKKSGSPRERIIFPKGSN